MEPAGTTSRCPLRSGRAFSGGPACREELNRRATEPQAMPEPASSNYPSAENPFLTDFDLHLLGEGTHYRSYEKLGAHIANLKGQTGVRFALWAPNAKHV